MRNTDLTPRNKNPVVGNGTRNKFYDFAASIGRVDDLEKVMKRQKEKREERRTMYSNNQRQFTLE